MEPLDPESLALSHSMRADFIPKQTPPVTKTKARKRATEKFLKGPIPLPLIQRATRLPGKAWHVYAALWFLKGLKQTSTVTLTQAVLNDFGVSRFAKYRALADLERAGLIILASRPGKNPVVTLCDPEEARP